MATEEQEEAYEKQLTAALARILDSQKFAETKNAALLTLNSAWIVVGVNLLSSANPLPRGLPQALALAMPLLVLSAIGVLISFLPKINLGQLTGEGNYRERSLIFFGDIAEHTAAEYGPAARARYLPPEGHCMSPCYEADLTMQVYVNSGIAARKFRVFNVCAFITLGASIVMALPGARWLFNQGMALAS